MERDHTLERLDSVAISSISLTSRVREAKQVDKWSTKINCRVQSTQKMEAAPVDAAREVSERAVRDHAAGWDKEI